MSGFIVNFLGAVVVLVHLIWTAPLAITVSAVGCIVAVDVLIKVS